MSAPMSEERLAEIREGIPPEYPMFVRLPETTADGDWVVKCGRVMLATVPDYAVHVADFIAAARVDVPDLLAEVERLRAALEDERGSHAATCQRPTAGGAA